MRTTFDAIISAIYCCPTCRRLTPLLSEVFMDTPLQPGTFVRLKNQPADLPDFVVEQCLGAFCWIRQQAWGDLVQWKVKTVMVEPVSKRVILQRLSSAMAQQG